MNIAILHFHRVGGSGIVAYEIAKQMVKRGHSIHFLGLEKPSKMIKNNKKYYNQCMYFHKITIEEYPVFDYQPYSLALASQLAEIIDQNNIEVIHSHYAIPHAISAILAKQIVNKNIKCVTTLHGTDITIVGSAPSMYRITKYSIEKSDTIVTVSQFLKNKTMEIFKVEENRIKVIHNFIDFDKLPTKFIPKPNRKEKIFLHASNLRAVKNPLVVIEIFNLIVKKKKSQDYKLWIVGDGPYKFPMMDLVKKYNLTNQVEFWGEHLDVDFYIKQADFFLFPSRGESFGLAALEAMAFGVPVIGTNRGGLTEIIENHQDGILFEPENIQFAVDEICKTIDNQEYYHKLSKNAFLNSRKKFSATPMIDAYENIYNEK